MPTSYQQLQFNQYTNQGVGAIIKQLSALVQVATFGLIRFIGSMVRMVIGK